MAIFHDGKCVAEHPRSRRGGHSTHAHHMPKAHAKHQEWTPSRFLRWANKIGPGTHHVVVYQFTHRPHPEHGYRAALGILSLAKKYGNERLEKACLHAKRIGGMHYKNLTSILASGIDNLTLEDDKPNYNAPEHANVRGADYYH